MSLENDEDSSAYFATFEESSGMLIGLEATALALAAYLAAILLSSETSESVLVNTGLDTSCIELPGSEDISSTFPSLELCTCALYVLDRTSSSATSEWVFAKIGLSTSTNSFSPASFKVETTPDCSGVLDDVAVISSSSRSARAPATASSILFLLCSLRQWASCSCLAFLSSSRLISSRALSTGLLYAAGAWPSITSDLKLESLELMFAFFLVTTSGRA